MTAVAEALERQVTSRLRECGLVVWLDKDGLYTDFVDNLKSRGDFYSEVLAYRGSYLELLLQLEKEADGLDPEPLLIHLPGHTDATVRGTPLLEAYKAGKRFDRSLATLVREVATGQVSAAEIERFLAQGDLTLQAAEEWLQGHVTADRTGLAAVLHHRKPEGVLEDLLQGKLEVPAGEEGDLERYLEVHTGLPATFSSYWTEKSKTARTLFEACVAWLMCVEYVGDLTRAPVTDYLEPVKKLSPQLVKNCEVLLNQLRKRHPAQYCELALQTEAFFAGELEAGGPEDLGRIDTFSREDSRLLEASVEALMEGHWGKALGWSQTRLDSPSVWLKENPLKRQEWQLVHAFATLGQALARSLRPLKGVNSLAEAVERYTSEAHTVDQAHRHFEQSRHTRLKEPQLRHFDHLHAAAARLRELYHDWADELGKDFAEVCLAHGFLPEPSLQQRTLYEQVVHPLTQRGKGTVAYFTVDALRYEMAQELAQRLTRPGSRLHLRARLAELPSVTSVGMNVLCPVAREGRLKVEGAFKGFRSGEYAVTSRQNRLRTMGDRSLETLPGGRRSPLGLSLREVSEMPPEELKKKVARTPLVVVHVRDLDSAGEADLGVPLFDPLLGELFAAVNLLRNAGVDEFVITADHGFLLLDDSRDPLEDFHGSTRRYVLTEEGSKRDATATVSLSSLGYDGLSGYLHFPRGNGVFRAKGDVAGGYVHGGNSLQERVIPVLTLSYASREITGLGSYRIDVRSRPPVLGLHRLDIRLQDDGQGLLSFESKVVPLTLRAIDAPAVQVNIRQPGTQHQQLMIPVGPEWVEVIFSLDGGNAPRAQLEVFHPNGDDRIDPLRLTEFFDVTVAPKASEPAHTISWEDAIEDQLHRRVLKHIDSYGSIDEAECHRLLGSPTAYRRFGRTYQSYLPRLPFGIDIDSSGPLKRYRKK